MADCMDKPNYGDKEQEQDADCWELVGSGPGSPLPEARFDGSALEEASAVACMNGGSRQDDYFACTRSMSEHDALSLSLALADRQSREDGRLSVKVGALIDSEADAGESSRNVSLLSRIAKSDEFKEGMEPMHGGSPMHYDDYNSHHQDMHLDDGMCHDDKPYRMYLDEHSDVSNLEQCKMDDPISGIYISEVMEHDDLSHIGFDTCDHDSLQSNEENTHCVNHSLASINVVESVATSTNGRQTSTLAVSQELETSSLLHGMHDNSMDIHSESSEDCISPTALRDASRESLRSVDGSSTMRGSLTNTHRIRYCKVFTCGSWIWTQLSRWQAQLGYAKTIWSVAFAAVVIGILYIGRGWQRLQAQNHSLRSQLWAKEKRITQLMFQLMQTKEALAKTRRVPVICVKPALQIP